MPFIYDNIWDLMRVLDYLELEYNNLSYFFKYDDDKVDRNDKHFKDVYNIAEPTLSIEFDITLGVGSTGISLGGMHSWFLAFADDRITCLAPAIGVQNFKWAVENNKWQERIGTIKKPFDSCMKA